MKPNVFKVVVIGEARVGKSSIALRYVHDQFDETSPSTTDACCLEKSIVIQNRKFTLSIWDTAGQQKYNALVPVYYRDAEAALIVYEITSSESFERVRKWISELKKYSNKKAIMAVVGNKTDLGIMRKVQKQQVQQFAELQNVLFFQVSAKTGANISAMFEKIGLAMMEGRKKNESPSLLSTSSRRLNRINLEEKQVEEVKKKKCCS